MPLDPSEQRHITAANGFLDLGMPLDADEELDRIDPFCRHLPEVLEVRCRIYLTLKRWELFQTVAVRLYTHDPDNVQSVVWLALANRRMGATEAAKALLLGVLNAMETTPEDAALHYELACCECLLGEIENAKVRLQHACKLDATFRAAALDEEDLRAVW